MTQTKSIVLAALFATSTSAVSLKYRPPEGSVPWTKPLTVPNFEDVKSHPVNYFVPDFGVDTDIIDSSSSIKQSEKLLQKELHADFGATKNPVNPRDYFVPDFGTDHEIQYTTNSIAQAESALGTKLHATFEDKKNPVNPRDYFVPDFGVDHDIEHVQHSIEISEKKLGHTLNADWGATKNGVNPRDYFVPDFGVDHEIQYTTNSISQAEKSLKHQWAPKKDGDHWVNMPAAAADSSYVYSNSSPEDSEATKTNGYPLENADIQLDSDPICSSAGCTQYKAPKVDTHPMDYFVPNFGQDHHIVESIDSEKWAAKEVGHTWIWQKEEKKDPVQYKIEPLDADMKASLHNLRMEEGIHGQWELPKEDTLINLQSDPICSSAGCTQYKQPEGEATWPMNYFVPDFGVDHDIKASFNGLDIAEKITGHNWKWEKTEKPKDTDPYKVPDFGIDEEIGYAQDGLKWAQSELGHKWNPTQDKNGFWNVPEAASAGSYTYA